MISLSVGSEIRINKNLVYVIRKESIYYYLGHPNGYTRLTYKSLYNLDLESVIAYIKSLHYNHNITNIEINVMGKWVEVYKKKPIREIKKKTPTKKHTANVNKTKRTVSVGQLVNQIKNSNGKFFAVVFRKRTDGTLRSMNCRLDVKKYLKGGKAAYKAEDYGLINVFDNDAKDYRTIPIEGLISAKIGGIFYRVKGRS